MKVFERLSLRSFLLAGILLPVGLIIAINADDQRRSH